MKTVRFLFIVFITLILFMPAFNVTAQEDQTGKLHFEQGVDAYNEKDYENSLRHFREAIKMDSSLEADVHLYIGRIAIQKKKWGFAAQEILRAKKLGLSKERKREADIALAYVIAYGEFPRRSMRKVEKTLNFHLSVSEEWMDGLALPLTVSNALTPVRKDDFRTKAAFGFDMLFPVTQKGKFKAGYDFFQSLYSDFTNLNLQSHTVSGRYSHEATKKLNLSANVGYTNFRLDESGFLETFSIGPSAFFHEKGSFFGRVGYNYANNDYKLNSGQDSDVHTISITQYWFMPNKKGFISGGYVHTGANATLKRWDYDMNRGFVSGKYQFNPKRSITGFISYSAYDYHGFDTLETTKKRDDDIFSFVTRYTYKVKDWADIFLKYSLSDHNSNLSRQDYFSNVVAIGTDIKW